MKTDYIIVLPIILTLTLLNIIYFYTTDNFDNFDIFTPNWIDMTFLRILTVIFILLIAFIITVFIKKDENIVILFTIIMILFLGITDNIEHSQVVEMFIISTIVLLLLSIILIYNRSYIVALPLIIYIYIYISIVYIKNNYI